MAKRGSAGPPSVGDVPPAEGTGRRVSLRAKRRRSTTDEVPENPRGQNAEKSVLRLRRSNGNLHIVSCPTPASLDSLDLHLSMSTGARSTSDVPPTPPPFPSPHTSPPHWTQPTRDDHKSDDDLCPICFENVSIMSSKTIAEHFRTIHSNEDASASSEWLHNQSVGVCPRCGEARPYTQTGALWRHKCLPRDSSCGPPREERKEIGDWERNPQEGTYRGLPWPTGVPHPPAGTPHPFTLALHTPVIRVIPSVCKQAFGLLVVRAANALADAVQSGSDPEKRDALVKFLSISHCLRKPPRGGARGNKKVRSNINAHIALLEEGGWCPPAEKLSPAEARERQARDRDAAKALSAEEIVGRGYLRKAAERLRSDEEVHHPSAEVVAHLRSKFPSTSKSPITDIQPITDDDPNYIITVDDFSSELKKTFNGACGGPSSLMGDHIKAVIGLSGVARALHRLFTLLINGQFPDWSHPFVCASRLIALGDKMRPICMSEWLMRTASKLCERTVPTTTTTNFFFTEGRRYKVLQFGTSVKGGAEAAVSLAKTLVHEEGKGRVMIEKDGINAYNQTDRATAVNDMVAAFPTTARWAKWAYGSPALLCV